MGSATRRVLCIDDDALMVRLTTALLQCAGHTATGFTSSDEAIQRFRADPGAFDVVMTDYNMPGKNGIEVAEALRAIRPDVPILLVSGHVTEDMHGRIPGPGATSIIYKPNSVDDLERAIASVLPAESGK